MKVLQDGTSEQKNVHKGIFVRPCASVWGSPKVKSEMSVRVQGAYSGRDPGEQEREGLGERRGEGRRRGPRSCSAPGSSSCSHPRRATGPRPMRGPADSRDQRRAEACNASGTESRGEILAAGESCVWRSEDRWTQRPRSPSPSVAPTKGYLKGGSRRPAHAFSRSSQRRLGSRPRWAGCGRVEGRTTSSQVPGVRRGSSSLKALACSAALRARVIQEGRTERGLQGVNRPIPESGFVEGERRPGGNFKLSRWGAVGVVGLGDGAPLTARE